MKKLKKGLSLLLVLAMVFSLASTAFAGWETEYKDDDQITQKEAVAVMTGMGIIEGDETTGLFDPAGQFTREAAAKIITYMVIGPDAAETLTTANTGFTDVAATRWSAPYVAYAKSQKIIEGYGDGTFGPANDLSRAAWLKMLLVSLGVDPDKYGMGDDANWDINAQAMAVRTGLVTAADLKLDWIRETAVYYAFKAMQAGQGIDIAKQIVSAEDAEKITVAPYVPTLTDKLDSKADEFGRPITTWTNVYKTAKDKEVYATGTEEPVATYTVATKEADVVKDLGLKKSTTLDGSVITKVYVDGVDTSKTYEDVVKANVVGATGVLVEFYANETPNTFTAVVINTYVKEIAKGDIDPDDGSVTLAQDVVYKGGDLAVGDIVSYNVGYDEAKDASVAANVTKLNGVDGKVTATNATKAYVAIDGTATYINNTVADEITIGTDLEVGNEYTFYYDEYGNILVAKEVKAVTPDGYAYMISAQTKVGGGDEGSLFNEKVDGTAAAKAQIIDLASGEISVVDLAITYDKDDQAWYYLKKTGAISEDALATDGADEKTGVADETLFDDAIYAYYKLDAGYVLVALDDEDLDYASDETASIEKDKADFGSKTLTSASKLTVVEYTKNEAGAFVSTTVTNYTGIAGLPKDSVDLEAAVAIVDTTKNNDVVTQAYAVVEKDDSHVAKTYAVFTGLGEADPEQHYEFVVGSENASYYMKSGLTADDAGNVYTITVGENGYVTAVKAGLTEKADTVVAVDDTFVKLTTGGVKYFSKDGVAVYNAKNDYAADEIKVGDTVKYVVDGSEIVCVIITDRTPA
jgi:hypothetical protein